MFLLFVFSVFFYYYILSCIGFIFYSFHSQIRVHR